MQSKSYTIDQVKAIILVGGRDFGRCPVATRLNRALWPIVDKPSLQYVIEEIARQGIGRFVICSDEATDTLQQAMTLPDHLDVTYHTETLPRGTAGCLKDASTEGADELLFVFQSMFVPVPSISDMMAEHRKTASEMTVFFYPSEDGRSLEGSAQLYICEKTILSSIPDQGYFDMKEGLIPRLVGDDKHVAAATLPRSIRGFRTWRDYLEVMGDYCTRECSGVKDNIVIIGDAQISPSAKLVGPVIIGQGAQIEEECVIAGPAVIGPACKIEKHSTIIDSVLWSHARLGSGCVIDQSLVDSSKVVRAGFQCQGQLLPVLPAMAGKIQNAVFTIVNRLSRHRIMPKRTLSDFLRVPACKHLWFAGIVLMVSALLATYAVPTLRDLWKTWISSDEYSSGMLVPPLAVMILWIRRKHLACYELQPALWSGIILLLIAQGVRFFGLYYMFSSFENISFIMTAAALCLLICGCKLFIRLISSLCFLGLMLPFPHSLQNRLAQPLQEWATTSAVFVLETCGFDVLREGNVINLNGTLVAVAEACNGLRMLTAFVVVSALVVMLSRRSRLERVLLLLSSVPIALLCNTIRLAVTAYAFTLISSEKWEKAFHDYGGLAMMPLALLMVVGELWLLSQLFYDSKPVQYNDSDVVYRVVKE